MKTDASLFTDVNDLAAAVLDVQRAARAFARSGTSSDAADLLAASLIYAQASERVSCKVGRGGAK